MAESLAGESLDQLEAPAEVRAAVARLRDDLIREAGANLAGLILYGGMARGRYRPGRSDINVVVLLTETSTAALGKIAPILRAAWRARRVEPFIITPGEVASLSVTFPTKLLDIANCHIVLAGDDPFAGLTVPREMIRQRIEQSLRNIELRLRRRYVSIYDDPASLGNTLAETAAALKVELGALLELAGKDKPGSLTTAAVLRAAAAAFDLDGATLGRIAALRHPTDAAPAAPTDDMTALYDRTLRAIGAATTVVSSM